MSIRAILVASALFGFLTTSAISADSEGRTGTGPSTSSDHEQMTFDGEPPNPARTWMLGSAWTIFAHGPIDSDAGKRLEAYLTGHKVPQQSFLYLDSPGGDLLGGMALGRVIRKYELRTYVGIPKIDARLGRTAAPGECYSACSLAFLGGEFRFLMAGSHYGVHRFAFQKEMANAVDLAQLASAAIVEYMREMDVDPDLFSVSTGADSTEIVEPTSEQLVRLNVVNNGATRPRWTVESSPKVGTYLKGERDTTFGINKFILMCDAKRIMLYVIFDPQNREQEILNFRADYLFIDGAKTSIEQARISRTVVNGWINAFYKLSSRQVAQIAHATSVGLAMLPTADAPIFFGFDSMPVDSDGSSKIQGFIRACKPN